MIFQSERGYLIVLGCCVAVGSGRMVEAEAVADRVFNCFQNGLDGSSHCHDVEVRERHGLVPQRCYAGGGSGGPLSAWLHQRCGGNSALDEWESV